LPSELRVRRALWYVPRKSSKSGPSYGFGQANVWFVNQKDNNPYLKEYINKLVKQIEEYDGENWL